MISTASLIEALDAVPSDVQRPQNRLLNVCFPQASYFRIWMASFDFTAFPEFHLQ